MLGGGSEVTGLAPSTPPTTQYVYGTLPTSEPPPADTSSTPMSARSLPATVDLTADAPPPGSQGQTGSCASWATGYSAMGWWANHSGVVGARFAPMYLYAQIAKGDCDVGAWAETPLAILESQGIDTQTDFEPMQDDLDCGTLPTSAQKTNAARFKITGYTKEDLSQGAQAALMSVLAGGKPAIPLHRQSLPGAHQRDVHQLCHRRAEEQRHPARRPYDRRVRL